MAETKLYNQVFQYLRDNQYPEGWTKDQKRNLRKKAKTFFLDDGALFFVANENSEPKRWVHDKKEQERILHACHSWDKLVFHRIGIDLVGPLPETSQGNKYLINCTCYFSKWPEAAPLETKSAKGMDECYIFSLAQRQKK